jgi:xylose isomerase
MKQWKMSANAGFFGMRRDRFNQYQPPRSLEDRFALVSQINEIQGIELKYPADFSDQKLVRSLLDQYNLALSAVNVDIKDVSYFRYGALSAPDPDARERAVRLLQEGMDLAADFGIDLVTTCPVMDGYDYPFQIDYSAAWDCFIDSVRRAASYRADINLLLEYQPHDPHAKILLDNVGKVLHVCSIVGAPNLGANLDVGHAFAAGESPSESATLLAGQGYLRYIHASDNPGDGGDWDMISGTVHFWEWIELLFTLERVGYQGWIGADIAPKFESPIEVYRSNAEMIRSMQSLLDKVGIEQVKSLQATGAGVSEIYRQLTGQFLVRV